MTLKSHHISRRSLLKASIGMAATSLCPGTVSRASGFESPNSRPRIGVIGCGVRWDKRVFVAGGRYGVGKQFPKFGDIVSVCDVDANRLDRAKGIVKGWLGKSPNTNGDYRKIIDDKRHTEVNLVDYSFCSKREFPDWAMGFVDLDKVLNKKPNIGFQPDVSIEEMDTANALWLLKEFSKNLHR